MATGQYVMLPDRGLCADSQANLYPIWSSDLGQPWDNAAVAARCGQYCTKLGVCRGFSVKAGSITCMLFFQWDQMPASMPTDFYGTWQATQNVGGFGPFTGTGQIKQVIFQGGVSCFYKKRNLDGQQLLPWMIAWETTPEPTQQPFGPPSEWTSTIAPIAVKASAYNVNFTSVADANSSNSSNSSSSDESSSRKLVMLDHLVSAGEKRCPKLFLASMLASLVLVIQKSM